MKELIFSLEDGIGTAYGDYKSKGEVKIAEFLDSNRIEYEYEKGILLKSYEGKQRLWYPDFYLPEFQTFIEYYGMKGDPDYNKGIGIKKFVYSINNIDVISVYPKTFSENWQEYIMSELEHMIKKRFQILKSKPYWSKTAGNK
jgi:hypothetical protein